MDWPGRGFRYNGHLVGLVDPYLAQTSEANTTNNKQPVILIIMYTFFEPHEHVRELS